MSEANKAIGIFDSGIGGLTVLKALEETLPNEHLIYLGDTARVPYGNKSRETVTRYSIENTQFLIQCGVKMIVVACNTASAFGVLELRQKFSIPILGVLEPGARAALKATKSHEIGVIGTEGTISSGSYSKVIQSIYSDLRVWGIACPMFVPLAEEGWIDGEITENIAKKYLNPFSKTPIDTLILGCTHYPLLKKVIGRVMGEKIQLVDSAQETALAVASLLKEKGLERQDRSARDETFFVTDSPDRFKQVGKNFLNRALEGVTLVSL
ncbi:MAG: glutamate racemase [Deltaproteobacteria bacterium]|nr:glutamate racemase [Deltaproteobacteria bacterium]